MDDSIAKRRNKYLSHNRISNVDEVVVVWLVNSSYDFVMKFETIFLVVLLKSYRLRSATLATATVKVCLKDFRKVHSIQKTDTVTVSRIVSVVDIAIIGIDVEVVTIITRPNISIIADILSTATRMKPFIPFLYSTSSIRKHLLSCQYCKKVLKFFATNGRYILAHSGAP